MTWIDQPRSDGSIVRHFTVTSNILRTSSHSGFNHVRPHTAYLPQAAMAGQRLPTIYLLASWMGAGRSMFNWEPFKEDLATRLSRLISSHQMPPCVVICPDLYTEFGGTQYINSTYIGNHADHVISELIPYVESHFPVLLGSRHRAILGRSSGGFGALRFGMDFSDGFAAIACHAGDMGFEWVYRRSLIDICVAVAKFKDPATYLAEIRKQKKLSGFDTHILMMLGMCAFYSPNPHAEVGFDLPINLQDGRIIEDIWKKWSEHDPVTKIDQKKCQDRLGTLKKLFIDCGNRDQYFLQYGSRQLRDKLQEAGISHIYSEFDDNHSGTAYRYDESLPILANAVT